MFHTMFPTLILVAFVPMIIACIWIRNTEKLNRESWRYVFLTFAWSASIAIIMSLILEKKVTNNYNNYLIISVIIAPIIEEFSKILPLFLIRKQLTEVEDGFIFGAISGLGFAATENLIYGMRYMDYSLTILVSLFYLRTIGTALLHASATSLAGYGLSLKIVRKKSIFYSISFFILAVLIHSIFNLFAFSSQISNQMLGTFIAVMFGFILYLSIRKKIIQLDLGK